MSLSEILAEASAQAIAAMPPEAVATLRKVINDLEASGAGDDALKAGDMLPDAVLTNPAGADVRIRDLLARGPLIVSFYRGSWCPYCNLELRAYQDILSEIEAAGAQLIAVTPQKPDDSLSTIEKNELKFAVLTDHGNAFARALGITFELGADLQALYGQFGLNLPAQNPGAGWSLPIPATYVANRDGKIVLAHVERDYTTRLEPATALAAIKSL